LPQIVIDPDNVGNPTGEIAIKRIPPAASAFGFVPNLKLCEAGDVILLRSRRPNFLSKLVEKAQLAAHFSPGDSCWTHAAIFLYEDNIAEAVPFHGVWTRSLYSYVPHKVLRVRRRLALTGDERYKIALSASRMLGARYSIATSAWIGIQALYGIWDYSRYRTFSYGAICSKVVYDAYAEITRHLLEGCPAGGPITPANLSASADFDDVPIEWLRLRR
jgi:hypothetical protein